MISSATRIAAGISVIAASRPSSHGACDGRVAAMLESSVISALDGQCASFETPPAAVPQDEDSTRLRSTIYLVLRSKRSLHLEARGTAMQLHPSTQPAGIFLQHRPGLGAVFRAPFGIEARLLQGGAEGLGIGFVEDQPFLFQGALNGGVELCHIGTLVERALREVPGNDLLEVFGQRLPASLVGEHPIAIPHMARERAEFLHFEELGDLDQGQRILLALDHLCLERRVDLGEIDAGRGRAERLEHRGPEGAHRHADLEALEIGGRVDGMRAAGDLPIAVVPHLLEGMESRLLDGAAHQRAELAIHRRPDMVIILEGEADAVDRRDGHQRRENEPRQDEEIDAAGAHLRQHVGVAAELVVGKDLDVEAAVRFLPDPLDHLATADIHGMIDGIVVGELQRELGRLRAAARQTDPGGRGGGGASHKASARYSHESPPQYPAGWLGIRAAIIPRGRGNGKGTSMRSLLSCLVILLAGCGASERSPPPYFVIPSGPPAQASAAAAPVVPQGRPAPLAPSPEVQYFLPGPAPGEIGRGPAPVPPRPSYAPLPATPNLGPVTGYGPGGMAIPPGGPPNPPYPRGGLMH